MSPELTDLAEGCVRCGEPFERSGFDAETIAQLTGRDLPEHARGRAICDRCIEADELRALAAPDKPPDS